MIVQPISIGFHGFWAWFTWSIECKTHERMGWTELWVRLSREWDAEFRSFQRDSIRFVPKCVAKIHFFVIRSKKFSILNFLRRVAFLTPNGSRLAPQKDQNSKLSKNEFLRQTSWVSEALLKFSGSLLASSSRKPYSKCWSAVHFILWWSQQGVICPLCPPYHCGALLRFLFAPSFPPPLPRRHVIYNKILPPPIPGNTLL